MSSISSIKTFTTEVLTSADLNSWFSEIRTKVNTYGAWLDASSQTFTGANTFSGAVTTSAGITVNTTGLTIAPQTAITFSHASARVVPGSTGLYFRNNANDADNVAITDAGAVTVRAGLTITAGGLTITSGDLTLSSGTLSIATLSVTGNTTLGDASGDTITFTGRVASHVYFSSDNQYDIGTSGAKPRDIYAARNIHVAGDAYLGSTTALNTSSTSGFAWIPKLTGTPTTSNPSGSGTLCALAYDYSSNRLIVWNSDTGDWYYVALSLSS